MKKYVIGFILGAIIFGSIDVAAAGLFASDITYTPKEGWTLEENTVEKAINDLYDRANSDINFIKVGSADLEFTSGSISPSNPRKMTINNLNTNYFTNNNNVYTVRKAGYYLFEGVTGSNTKNDSGQGYSSIMQILVNNELKLSRQQSYSYYIFDSYLSYLNVGDTVILQTYADGGSVAKRTSFDIYTLDYDN